MTHCGTQSIDPKALVAYGYDRCSADYEEARRVHAGPEIGILSDYLIEGGRVLDIGCGSGIPIARKLAHRFEVVGVDISAEQIRRARANVPSGTFIHGDIMSVSLLPNYFDAVVSFYSLFHLPREEHPELFRRIHKWLKPRGFILLTATLHKEEDTIEGDFFGVPMFYSNFGVEDYKVILGEAGFRLLNVSFVDHGYKESKKRASEIYPLILAQAAGNKPHPR